MARALGVGLVGLGAVSESHLAGYRAASGISLVAGADPDAKRAAFARAEYGLATYANFAEMTAHETLDIICVLTPASLHRTTAVAALRQGYHVFCEKPLAAGLDDAMAIAAAARAAPGRFMFGASYRQLPTMIAARTMVQQGQLGQVRMCRETLIGGNGPDAVRTTSPIHYPVGGPGGTPMGLVDHGVHLIDGFCWIVGQRPTRVYGRGNISGGDVAPEFAIIELDGGATVHLSYDEATFATTIPSEGLFTAGPAWNLRQLVPAGHWDDQPCELHIHGSKGALRIYPYANMLVYTDRHGTRTVPVPPLAQPNHFRTQIEAFAAAISGEAVPIPTVEDGLESARVLDAIYRSAQTGHGVSVNDVPA